MRTVVALAGRRIDAPDADEVRFPLENADAVRARLREVFRRCDAVALVCSAACGADLLALEVAGGLHLRRVVVLPFNAASFRRVSVIDRPGGEEIWGRAFDRIMASLPDDDLIVLRGGAEQDAAQQSAAFDAANPRILSVAQSLGDLLCAQLVAVVVWDGVRRGLDDVTAQFADDARERRVTLEELSTILPRDNA